MIVEATDVQNYLTNLPQVSERRVALHVTPAAERALRSGHPWLFAEAIVQQSHNGRCGDLAVIFDRKRRFLAIGLYDPFSPIRVRVLQYGQPATINAAWFQARVTAVAQLRHSLLDGQTTGYRLIHGENDGLPGLVVDRYGSTLVIKLYSAAWIPHLPVIMAVVTAVATAQRLVLRLSRQVAQQKEALFGLGDGDLLYGPPLAGPVRFLENGLTFEADVVEGQKTGFFLDQRDNRARVEQLAQGKSVLNVFAYTGGFSLYAARGGARSVVSLDISRPALAEAVRHFELNRQQSQIAAAEHEIMVGDAFKLLEQLGNGRRRFDLVILDPPAFARRRDEVGRALAAYRRLTRLGLAVLKPGGTLVAASCSSRVSAEDFFAMVERAAREMKRPLRNVRHTGHALDHPVGFKEGAYLKCLFASAD